MAWRLRTWLSSLGLVSVLAPLGCGDDRSTATGNFSASNGEVESGTASGDGDGDGDGDGAPGDGDGDGDGTPGDGDGTPGDGDGDGDGTPGDGDGDGDGTPGDGDGDGDGDGAPGDGDGDGDGAPACAVDPGDDACLMCTKSSCCDDWLACEADADCVCLRDCIDAGNSFNQCRNMCGVQGQNANYQTFKSCRDTFCAADC